jgi:hypothetical protein
MRSVVALACIVLLAGCIQVQVPTTEPPTTEPLLEGPTYEGPVVEFGWSPSAPRVGQATTFVPEVRVLKGTHIATWAWDFGDGGKASTPNAAHAFASAGLKTVTLTVRSSDGLKGTASHVVPVAAAGGASPGPSGGGGGAFDLPAPVIASVADADRQAFSFSYTWSAEPDTVGWDFGDGTSSNLDAPTHPYAEPGSYRVALHLLRGSEVHSAFATIVAGTPFTFQEFVVKPAVDYTGDLYEPTIEVSDSGVVYITGHTIAIDTTGAPVFFSRDDGATWKQLPFSGTQTLPSPLQGATPPPSDEIFLIAGDDGWVYGVDITLATFPVNGWSGNGEEHSYHNPNAYDESDLAGCAGAPIKDRPWGAYSNGTLLMVNNQGGLFPAQVGVLQVPPELPVGVGAGTAQWNLCAGRGGGIPGIPDLRADGVYAVPQLSDGSLWLVVGHKSDVLGSHLVEAFPVETEGEITSVYGIAAFDKEGTLFVGISNNTKPTIGGAQQGRIRMGTSLDGGESFVVTDLVTGDRALRHFYMDPNDFGPGALVVWAVDGDGDDAFDWYTGHIQLAPDGGAVLGSVLLAIDEGPEPSAHVTGAAVGPDGRAYLAMYRGVAVGGTPLSVFVQQDGPTLPLALPG